MGASPATDQRLDRTGLACGLAAYAAWGVLPVYFKAVESVGPVDLVAHRVCWSLLTLALVVTAIGGWPKLRAAFADRAVIRLLLLSSALVATNWLLYVYAIDSGQVLAGSLGYYMNPLANILLGYFFLSERLSRMQWLAVAIAAAGVSVLAVGALSTLWLSFALCISFSLYGFVRKKVAVDSLTGLVIETVVLVPLALLWLGLGLAAGRPIFGDASGATLALLAVSGVVTCTPLLLFTEAARRLPYSVVGMLQFIAPTLQFLLAVAAYHERFTHAHAVAFGAIWIALGLFVAGQRRPHDNRASSD
ncbi:EamA family transporter RarD [Sphingomonas sp. ASV193]|uniref:EamA family transporter RarD n=1 Tax=Sphingomonas sp. ASV193 TaxID=3144405 RepID=UPI0032E9337D